MAENETPKTLMEILEKKGDKISKAERVRIMLKIQRKLFKAKKSMSDFREPALFLVRRTGDMEFYENATSGKFVYKHSSGEQRWADLRPQDQLKFDYGDRKVRAYILHEDRPFSGFENSALDTEGLVLAINKMKATDRKYEETLLKEKNKGRRAWIWILLAIAGMIAIIIFALGTWGQPILAKIGQKGVETASSGTAVPSVITLGLARKFKLKRN